MTVDSVKIKYLGTAGGDSIVRLTINGLTWTGPLHTMADRLDQVSPDAYREAREFVRSCEWKAL